MEKIKYRIMIETSSVCNAKCEFCANPTLIREKKIMDDITFDTVIGKILLENIDVEKFILHLNGEPFTDSKLIDRITILKSNFPNVPIWFTTNFSIPDEQKIEELLRSGLDTITISLNAVEADEYEKITNLNFEKTMKNVEYLLKRNRELGDLIHVRFSIVDCGKENQVKRFKDKFSGMADIRVIKLGRWIGKEAKEIKHRKQNIQRYCDDLYHQICILSNGDFAICSFDCEGQVGKNIMDTNILEAFYSERYEELRKQHKNGIVGTMCENCSFSYIE